MAIESATALEVAWLAGLLEGEGCFSLDRRLGGAPGRDSIRVRVQMTDKDIVKRAAEMINAHSVYKLHDNRSNRKVLYSCGVSGAKAEKVMLAVRLYMGERRGAKIDELLALPNLSHHPKEKND